MRTTTTTVPVLRESVVASLDMLNVVILETPEGRSLLKTVRAILETALIEADEAHRLALRADGVCLRSLDTKDCPLGHVYDRPDGLPRAALSLEWHEAEGTGCECGGRGVGCCVNADIPLPGVER